MQDGPGAQFHKKLVTLCDEYNVFIETALEKIDRPTDKIIFRKYTLSIRIQKDAEAKLLVDLIE